MTPERLISLCNAKSVNPQNIGLGGPPEWTPSDAALACKGLSMEATAAFRFRWARDDSCRHQLYGCLMYHTAGISLDEFWPATVTRLDGTSSRYIEDLVRLAILEEHHGHLVRLASLWPDLVNVTPLTWTRKLSRRYEAVRSLLTGWCDEAHHHIMRQIRHTA